MLTSENKKWKNKYRLALRFASYFNIPHRFDIVHSAWLLYYDKTGYDLFEEDPISFIYTNVKHAFYKWHYKERKGENYVYNDSSELLSSSPDPEQIMIGEETYNTLYQKLLKIHGKGLPKTKHGKQLVLEIFKLKAQGYDQKIIADTLGVSKTAVHHHISKIQQMSPTWINPFHGSKLEVKKTITESQWERRQDHDDFVEEDSNEYYRLLVHSESKEGLLIRLHTPERNPYIK